MLDKYKSKSGPHMLDECKSKSYYTMNSKVQPVGKLDIGPDHYNITFLFYLKYKVVDVSTMGCSLVDLVKISFRQFKS